MAQKPTRSIQIFSQDGNYENGKCICISENVGNDTNRQIIFMTQSNNNKNNKKYQNFGNKHTNKHGIPNHVFEDPISPVRLSLTKYVKLLKKKIYRDF